jgi:uncharacterized protein (UPF0332 family)
LFSWGDFLELADELWKKSDAAAGTPAIQRTEALRRTVIGRAYYAAFQRAKAVVQRKYPGARGGNEHDKTWTALSSSSDRNEVLQGQKGDNLKRLRHRADYKSEQPVTDAEVMKALRDARTLREALSNIGN